MYSAMHGQTAIIIYYFVLFVIIILYLSTPAFGKLGAVLSHCHISTMYRFPDILSVHTVRKGIP